MAGLSRNSEELLIKANVAITKLKHILCQNTSLEPTMSIINECNSEMSQAAKVPKCYYLN